MILNKYSSQIDLFCKVMQKFWKNSNSKIFSIDHMVLLRYNQEKIQLPRYRFLEMFPSLIINFLNKSWKIPIFYLGINPKIGFIDFFVRVPGHLPALPPLTCELTPRKLIYKIFRMCAGLAEWLKRRTPNPHGFYPRGFESPILRIKFFSHFLVSKISFFDKFLFFYK